MSLEKQIFRFSIPKLKPTFLSSVEKAEEACCKVPSIITYHPLNTTQPLAADEEAAEAGGAERGKKIKRGRQNQLGGAEPRQGVCPAVTWADRQKGPQV